MESAKRNSWAIYWLHIIVLLTLVFCNYQFLTALWKDSDNLISVVMKGSVVGGLLLGCLLAVVIGGIFQVDEDDLFGAMIVCELGAIIFSAVIGLLCGLILWYWLISLVVFLTLLLTTNTIFFPILSWIASKKT